MLKLVPIVEYYTPQMKARLVCDKGWTVDWIHIYAVGANIMTNPAPLALIHIDTFGNDIYKRLAKGEDVIVKVEAIREYE